MNRLQVLVIALEVSAIVWMGAYIGGRWVARGMHLDHAVEISANAN